MYTDKALCMLWLKRDSVAVGFGWIMNVIVTTVSALVSVLTCKLYCLRVWSVVPFYLKEIRPLNMNFVTTKINWKCFKIVKFLPSITQINTKTRKHEINSLQTNMIENLLSNFNFYLSVDNNSRDIPNNNFWSPPLPVEHTWSIFIGGFAGKPVVWKPR